MVYLSSLPESLDSIKSTSNPITISTGDNKLAVCCQPGSNQVGVINAFGEASILKVSEAEELVAALAAKIKEAQK